MTADDQRFLRALNIVPPGMTEEPGHMLFFKDDNGNMVMPAPQWAKLMQRSVMCDAWEKTAVAATEMARTWRRHFWRAAWIAAISTGIAACAVVLAWAAR